MFWEGLGLPGSPASDAVESLAQWVQWAQSGIMAGASANESDVRYNLNQFWTEKVNAYPDASPDEQAQMNRLDVIAHGLLAALDSGKMVSASPGYWDYWKAYLFGGTPSRPDSAAAAVEAKAAALDAATGAAAAGQPTMAQHFTNEAASIDQQLKNANTVWDQGKGLIGSPLGIPLWAWLVGGALLFIYLKAGKR